MEAVYSGIDARNGWKWRRAVATEPKPTRVEPSRSPPPKLVNGSASSPPSKPLNGTSTRLGDVSQEIKRVRAQMEENEDLAILMRGLRGQNLSDSQFADDSVQLKLVEVDESSDLLPMVYDPATISAYWGKRPQAVATRIVQLLSVAGGFLSSLIWDLINKKVKENEVARAIELRDIVTSLGPAYIKLGQALSIRPDILSPAAMVELQKLCDKVPSYPDDIAMELIKEELGKPWQEIYSELSPSPIAAASLGQVYKGKLIENGDMVAVKVQRPYVLETVSIDVVGLVDEWAARFFEELDYINEGENGTHFAEMMKKDLPQVVVPKTYTKYTSRKVLTTSWIEGEKLSQSKESDVGELVNVGVICYLKQLLDTGFFHADPHPGNMIRTPDGKLAILDFGLVTKLTDDQKYGMIEAIAHLIHRDYGAIALEGGGAKNINFQELAADLAQITFDYPFRIPPYFALIIRAIGVLEGIALVGNPEFAIVDEAYPYIAQKDLLMSCKHLRISLQQQKVEEGRILMEIWLNLVFFKVKPRKDSCYLVPLCTISSRNASSDKSGSIILLSDKGNFFREFLLDEIVKGIDAVTREQLVQLMSGLGIRSPNPVFSMVPAFGSFRTTALVPTITQEDRIILNNVQKIVEFLTEGTSISRQPGQGIDVARVVQELLPILPGISAKVLPEVITRLSSRVLARVIRDTFL
ncbi:unnamed protein product [Rhodiola kirilowii]